VSFYFLHNVFYSVHLSRLRPKSFQTNYISYIFSLIEATMAHGSNSGSTQHHCPGRKIYSTPCRTGKIAGLGVYCVTHQDACRIHDIFKLQGERCISCIAADAAAERARRAQAAKKKEEEAAKKAAEEANKKIRKKERWTQEEKEKGAREKKKDDDGDKTDKAKKAKEKKEAK
ncbi:uncharacterized protein F4807DRAFT_46860, partial [Annulohypoxylon truncatum]|uniref:uncharacterized protein n=1 Tax=Annulohypoxylon truncatum TaxID=327061 RepID=UPI002007AF79